MNHMLLLTSLIFSSLAFAQPGPMRHGLMGPGGRERLIERLDLTADQAKQFETLSAAVEKKAIAVRSNIMALRVDLRGLIREENPVKADIQSVQGKINTLRGELQANRTNFWFDVNKILIPEQRKGWKHALSEAPADRSKPIGRGRWNRHLGM